MRQSGVDGRAKHFAALHLFALPYSLHAINIVHIEREKKPQSYD